MDSRVTKLRESFIINSSCVTIGKEKVGAGNFADVYKGILRQNKIEKEVAVKVVRYGGGNTDNELHCLSEMSNEALIMSLHKHKGIIEFLGVSIDKIPMIIMEYCVGGSLDLHLQRFKEHIRTAERIRYLLEISNGMRYLERKQCVHRDLATRNVLIAADGFLRICDFGLSRCPSIVPPKETGNSHIPIRWMAPESLTRNPIYSTKSDMWSFGVVIYETFNCGLKPWPEKPVKWIATKIRKGITPELPKRIPRLLRELVIACFQRDPTRRPSFKHMSGRLLLIQSLRFPSPDPRLLTLSQIKNVVPTAPIEEKDSEAICIEFDEKLNEQSIVISYAPRSIIQAGGNFEKEAADHSKEDDWGEVQELSVVVPGKVKDAKDKNVHDVEDEFDSLMQSPLKKDIHRNQKKE
uniref:Tyrosine-protein kinase Fer n=1 Tax=Ascaris suum TaxID=6253 RepID=F1L738_ASCSU